MTDEMNYVLGNAILWVADNEAKKKAARNKFREQLILCIVLTLFVGLPVLTLAIQHVAEAKACGERIECQF